MTSFDLLRDYEGLLYVITFMTYAMVIKANTHAYSHTVNVATGIAHMPITKLSQQ